MLADTLEEMRGHLVDELERRIAFSRRAKLVNGTRRARLDALLCQVIKALRSAAGGDLSELVTPVDDPEFELEEHAEVESYLTDKIQRTGLQHSPSEAALLHAWRYEADRECLREQNRRLTTLLDGVNESAALLTPDGRILYCNRHAAQALHEASGVGADELIGKTLAELGVPLEVIVGRTVNELTALARAHEIFEFNAWGRARETQFGAVYGPNGSIAAVALLVRDIHGRKQTQTRLGLLAKLSGLAGVLDYEEVAQRLAWVPIPELADWCAVNVVENGRIRRTFLATRDPSKLPLQDTLKRAAPTWETHPLWQELLAGGFQLLTQVTDDLLHKLATTPQQYALLSGLGVQSLLVMPLVLRGQTSGVVTLAYTPESGRRYGRDDPPMAEEFALHAAHALQNARLMKDLKSSEARFRIALAGARTVVFEQDAWLHYKWYYNPLGPADAQGKTLEEALPPAEAARLTTTKRQVLERGDPVYDEVDLTLANAERRHYREAIEPVRDASGRVVGIIGAATDITEQHRMKEQLTDDLNYREQMMGVLGHDLRSPLNAIGIAGDLLLRRPDMPAEARDQVQRIRRASGRMKEMIGTLLDFTRVRSMGKLPVSPVPADLGEIARAAIDELRQVRPDHPIQLEVRGEVCGTWDPARVTQVISNLVCNAITYGDAGAEVTVVVEGSDREVSLSVNNHGPPIPPELLPVIFEPFRRGVPVDRSPGGLGLGLYIAQQVVLAHGGRLGLQSTAQEGTTFTMRLPRDPGSSA